MLERSLEEESGAMPAPIPMIILDNSGDLRFTVLSLRSELEAICNKQVLLSPQEDKIDLLG